MIVGNGIRIATRCVGRIEDPCILLISGHSSTKTQWRGFDEELASRGLRVIAFDNRDSGCSQFFDDVLPNPDAEATKQREDSSECIAAYSIPDMVADAIAVLDYWKVTSAAILGQSMGGLLAQVLCTTYPSRVQCLIAIMTAVPFWPALAQRQLRLSRQTWCSI